MKTNIKRTPCHFGDYPNSCHSYGQLRQVPVNATTDAQTTCDKDACLLSKGALPQLPVPLRRPSKRNHQDLTGRHELLAETTSRTLTHLDMATPDYSKWHFFNVYLDLTEKGLGMSIRGGTDSPDGHGNTDIFVSRILSGGAVHQDGRLDIGDILIDVNGTSLENVTHKCAVDSIVKAQPYVHLYVKRPQSAPDSTDIYEQIDEETEDEPLISGEDREDTRVNLNTHFNNSNDSCIKVELIRDDNGFGFSLAGGIDNQMSPHDSRIYVSKLVENSPAHLNGLIQVGDMIVAVNDINLERVPYNWALNQIRNSPALSIFTVRKAIIWD